MYVEQLIILNLRSCRNVHVKFEENSPNVVIGVNDSGKTTIIKALDMLFSEKNSYSFLKDSSSKRDLSNTVITTDEFSLLWRQLELPAIDYDGKQTVITAKIKYSDGEIDSGVIEELSNTAIWALENSSFSYLWYLKVFNNSDQSVKSYILTADAVANGEPIAAYKLSQAGINGLISSLGVDPSSIVNENNVGPPKNIEKIKAIYRIQTLSLIWCEFKVDRADKKYLLPIFRYLDWHCSLDDIKRIANDALEDIYQTQIQPIREQINAIKRSTQNIVDERLQVIRASISEDFPNISSLKTNVLLEINQSITDITITKLNTDGDIHLDNQGEGIKRQIWFSMLKIATNVQHSEVVNTKYIWAFDEPETHLYPTAQRQLFEIIKSISDGHIQTILCTHSTIFINKARLNLIQSTNLNESGYTDISYCSSIDDIYEGLQLLNSDFLFYNKFLVTEGDTELQLLPKLYNIYTNSTLESDNIKIINIKGKDKWVQAKQMIERIFLDFRKTGDNIVYLFDNDLIF